MAHTQRPGGEDRVKKERNTATARAVGKGFFVALALCLIAVGGMAVVTFSDTWQTASVTEQSGTTAAPLTTKATTSAAPAAAIAVTTTVTKEAVTTTTSEAAALFVLPLSNQVINPFCETPVYSETMDDYRAHLGVDFSGEEGQTVRALADGTVTAVSEDALWGGSMTVDHGGGIVSVYRGVEATVSEGAVLSAGDAVGLLRGVPCESAAGPHLHLELYRQDKAVDVCTLLSAQLTTVADD